MTKQIDKLTPEQEAMIPVYLEEYLKIALSTEPCDRAKAEAAVKASYRYQKLPEPEVVWADSPFAGAKIAAQLENGTEDVTPKQIAEQASKASYGSFEAYWVSFYAFIAEQLPVQKDELIDIVKDIVKNCGVYWTFEDVVVLTEKPVSISMVNDKLHDTEKKALLYKDGSGVCAVNGVVYSSLLEVALEGAMSNNETKQAEELV